MKINGICITYLDDYKKENWPKEFVEVPRVGDIVESQSGKHLRVMQIIHTTTANKDISHRYIKESNEPIIKIELGKII
jgi:hypothetical protein